MFDILINEKGGTAIARGRDMLEDTIRNRLGDQIRSLHFSSGADIAAALNAILDTDPQAVLIGGGDGTISLCGVTCMKAGVPFGIIPLGTMNLMAQDLGIPTEIDECLQSYARHKTLAIDTGSVNDVHFFCNTIIGIVPEAAVARENIRDMPSIGTWAAFAETILKDMGSNNHETVHVRMRNIQRTIHAKSIIVANNTYVENPADATKRLARQSLTDGRLTIYSATPRNIWQSLRLLFRVWLGGWPKDPAISSFHREEIILDAASQELLVCVDGEPVSLSLPLHFKVHPRAARVIVPA